MVTKRLNDTAAIAAMPDRNLQKHESRSVSVEKIDNGYVTTETSTKDGLYECRKTFSENQPDAVDDKGDSSMQRAVDYMKQNGTL